MAVHTELTKVSIKEILNKYELGELISYEGIKEGIENTNYLIVTKKDRFIVTIFEKRVDVSQIPFFFEVMINSHSNGIQCPTPIKDRYGEFVNKIKNKKMAVFKFLEGQSKKKWTNNDCFQVGQKLAKFHLANKKNKVVVTNSFGLNYWKKTFKKCSGKLETIIPNSYKIIHNEIAFISSNWPRKLPGGIIHADLFPDNVFFKKKNISGFLDFYFSCFDFLSYDLAITVNAWCFNKKKFVKKYFLNLLSGYESIRKLQKEEIKNFNILLRGAALRFLFTRVYDSINYNKSEFLKPKDPLEFYEILNFHVNIKSPEYYFE